MNRTKAEQLDYEIRECLDDFSIERELNPEFGRLIMDNYLEIIPDDSKRQMIFLGENSVSHKLGNIRLDLRSVLIAFADFVASLSDPDTYFQYIQLIILSALCVGAITKKEIDMNCAIIIDVLHKFNAYERGYTAEQVKTEIRNTKYNNKFENFNMNKYDDSIASLLKWKVIDIIEEKIYLNEIVWGKVK